MSNITTPSTQTPAFAPKSQSQFQPRKSYARYHGNKQQDQSQQEPTKQPKYTKPKRDIKTKPEYIRNVEPYSYYLMMTVKACKQQFLDGFTNDANYDNVDMSNVQRVCSISGIYTLNGPVPITFSVRLSPSRKIDHAPSTIEDYFVDITINYPHKDKSKTMNVGLDGDNNEQVSGW